jgi:thiol-disulfide isomerase/thioredoxin
MPSIRIGLLAALTSLALGGCPNASGAAGRQPSGDTKPTAGEQPLAMLPIIRQAPELTNRIWLNSEPLPIYGLKGKVVLIDFWAFGCINCQHVKPSLKSWHARYAAQGLIIIGDHFPEFGHGADLGSLMQAVELWGISYPVSQDTEGQTWRAYGIHCAPKLVLIDKSGRIRYQHIGEGAYAAIEQTIRSLLGQPD